MYLQPERDLSIAGMYIQSSREIYQSPPCIHTADSIKNVPPGRSWQIRRDSYFHYNTKHFLTTVFNNTNTIQSEIIIRIDRSLSSIGNEDSFNRQNAALPFISNEKSIMLIKKPTFLKQIASFLCRIHDFCMKIRTFRAALRRSFALHRSQPEPPTTKSGSVNKQFITLMYNSSFYYKIINLNPNRHLPASASNSVATAFPAL